MNEWITNFMKGCATCQQNKNLTHRKKIPLFPFPASTEQLPFKEVAMDLITQLPKSQGYDAILTTVDQGCSRAAVFIPCKTAISGEEVATLYLENVYRWFGLPNKIISDRDPRFTSHFAKALCRKLQINQNISTAFHLQTDGLSERKNQWVEQYLHLVTSARQEDWQPWLAIATTVHNNRSNATTRVAPNQVLLGYLPTLDPKAPPNTPNERVEERTLQAKEFRAQAQAAIDRVANKTPEDQFGEGDTVWLEAKNLTLPYQTRKLAPKCHGPFTITKKISPVAYQLQLPLTWTIHDVFHASLLTPYRETKEHGINYNRPPPELVKGEQEFEVEAITGHRFFGWGRKLEYLIKWKGYPTADNTWETDKQVFAPKLKNLYHRKHSKDRPFPHKRGGKQVVNSILSCLLRPVTSLHPHPPRPLLPSQFRHLLGLTSFWTRKSDSKSKTPPPSHKCS